MISVADEIKKKVDVVDVIQSYIPVKRAGRNFKAVCPFHKEKSPSFFISPDRQIWHCFGSCNEGGDVISFVMKMEGLTFFEAAQELSRRYGLQISFAQVDDAGLRSKDRLYSINKLAADYYQYVLEKTPIGSAAREYLENRGIRPEISRTFQIGYAPDSWDSLMKYLYKKNVTVEEMDAVGLTVLSERKSRYDRFRGRIIFPIKDTRGNIIAFSGRVLKEQKDNPGSKYVNTPETTIYHKRETLFGIYTAKEAIKREGFAMLVEGEFDVISPYQYGIENAVAVKGSAITKEQLQLLKRYATRIVFALDADATGIEAVKRGAQEAEALDFEIEVMSLSLVKDPDEAVRKDLPAFKKALQDRVPIYDFVLQSLVKQSTSDDPFAKKKIAEEISKYIATIQNPVIKSHYVKKTAEMLGISEESVQRTMYARSHTQLRKRKDDRTTHTPTQLPRETTLQKYVLGCILQQRDGYDEAMKEVDDRMFTVPAYRSLYHLFHEFHAAHPAQSGEVFAQHLPAELVPVFNELYLFASYEEGFGEEKSVKVVLELKRMMFKRLIQEALSTATEEAQDEAVALLTKGLTEVEKRLALL